MDLGLVFRGEVPGTSGKGERLEPAGSFNAMCTHRVRLSKPADVDATLKKWLAMAYETS